MTHHGRHGLTLKLVLLGVVTLGAVGVALWRSQVLSVATGLSPDPEKQAAKTRRAAVQLYRDLTFTPRSAIASEADLAASLGTAIDSALARVPSGPGAHRTPDEVKAIREQVVSVVFNRFLQPDFVVYHQSMIRMGFHLCDTSTLRDRWFAHEDYERATGAPCPPDISAEKMVGALWDAFDVANHASKRLEGIGTSDAAVEVAFQRTCPNSLDRWPRLSGTLGDTGWHGSNVGAFSFFYEPPRRNWVDVYKAMECFETATVGVVLRQADGHAFPYLFFFWYDDQLERWWLGQIAIGNMTEEAGGAFF